MVIPSLCENYHAEKFWLRLQLTELLYTNKINTLGEVSKKIIYPANTHMIIFPLFKCVFLSSFGLHTKKRAEYSD